jgi:hypothetical protein
MTRVVLQFLGLVLISLSYMVHAQEVYVVAATQQRVRIYNEDGLRLMEIEPATGRIVRTEYREGRPVLDTFENRRLPSLPWHFAPDGGFFAFDTTMQLRYYPTLERFDSYSVPFAPDAILQVIDSDRLLVRYQNNALGIWRRSTNQLDKIYDAQPLAQNARYIDRDKILLVAKEDRLDYYTNPAQGLVSSRLLQQIDALHLGSMQQRLELPKGSHLNYDVIYDRVLFFTDKQLFYWQPSDSKPTATMLKFDYLLTSVAGSWQVPSAQYLGDNKYLVWHRIAHHRLNESQLALYDGTTGKEQKVWQLGGEQGSLSLIKVLP